ncbi:hypothetical protein [Deinococcus alpinitundrae]|uniref:hypothetical protein n=1 Tax=Deinococcus alpinitundrae TaxID=468913 RepID=UPI0013799580|nr:hypothetical protein [Deinococcus alpinitundrae]
MLISSPAGTGKSTVLAAWLRQQSRPAAWLPLDKGDNDLGQFLLYLVSAVQQLGPGLGVGLPELLRQQSEVSAEPLLIQLTNDLAQLGGQVILVTATARRAWTPPETPRPPPKHSRSSSGAPLRLRRSASADLKALLANNISWSAVSGVSVVVYRFDKAGSPALQLSGLLTTASFTDAQGTPDSQYQLRAVDERGQMSALTPPQPVAKP